MTDATLIRGVGLMVPLIGLAIAWTVVRPGSRVAAGALLATLWNLASLLGANLLALRAGWWAFDAKGGLFLGLPMDLMLGWAILWGALPAVTMRRWPVVLVVVLLVWVDALVMPLGEPVVRLGEAWLLGEAVAVAAALLPGLLLARWTAGHRCLAARATMQAVLFGALVYLLLPAVIFEQQGRGWPDVAAHPRWLLSLAVHVLALPLAVGLTAVQRFVTDGGGTPLPYDPPRRLVTSGPYAYVANPMQLSCCLGLAVWGVVLGDVLVALAGPMAVAVAWSIANWHEREQMSERFGESWRRYRRKVRNWIPQWRPVDLAEPDCLYVAAGCDACAELGRWFERRAASSLQILSAEEHPDRLRRITYVVADGNVSVSGVAAVARALERIHLGWAMVGWLIDLPVVRQAVQLLVDAVGGGPRDIHHPRTNQSAASR